MQAPPTKDGQRINEDIRVPRVLLIDQNGEKQGIMPTSAAMHRFFEEGDKVKVTLRFRGGEMRHPELGMKLLDQVKEDFDPVAKVEHEPKMEGRQMVMILAPR